MFTATPTTRQQSTAPRIEDRGAQDVIETRLWLDEHVWLYKLLRSARPKHRAAANRCGGTSTSCCWIYNVHPLTGTPTPSSNSTN